MDHSSVLKLMIWKNFQKQKRYKFALFGSIFFPAILALIMVFLRYSVMDKNFNTNIQSFDVIEPLEYWNILTEKIESRRNQMLKEQSTFKSNVFIPNIKVAFAPNTTNGIQNLVTDAMDKLGLTSDKIEGFIDCNVLRETAFALNFLASLCFHNVDETINGLPQKLNFSIILPSELRNHKYGWVGKSWKTNKLVASLFKQNNNINNHLTEGVMPLQYFVSLAYLQAVSTHSFLPEIYLRRMSENDMRILNVLDKVKIEIVLSLLVSFLYPIIVLTKHIVEERQVKQHILMGLNTMLRRLQLFSWFFNGFCVLLITSILLTTVLKIKWNGIISVADKCPWFIMLIFWTFFSMSLVSFCILLSVVIRTTKIIAALVPMYWILTPLSFIYIQRLDTIWIYNLLVIASLLLCNVNFSQGILKMLLFENFNNYVSAEQYITIKSSYTEHSMGMVIFFFLVQTVLYLVLAFFFEIDVFGYLIRLPFDSSIWQRYKKLVPTRSFFKKRKQKPQDAEAKQSTILSNWSRKWSAFAVNRNSSAKRDSDLQIDVKQFTDEETSSRDSVDSGLDHNLYQLLRLSESSPDSFYHYFIDSYLQPADVDMAYKPEIEEDSDMESHPVVIEFDNVWKKYPGGRLAVRRLTLKVRQGEIFVLLGNNASGKTTIINMLCGLTKPSHGKIYINGFNVANHSTDAFSNIEACLHGVDLFPEFTLRQHLIFLCCVRGLTKEDAILDTDSYLHAMGLNDIAHINTRKLTNGQKRIMVMLCAFAGRRKIVLLDKPVECVDQVYIERFYNFVLSQQKDRTIFITTNFPKVAGNLGGRIAILSEGTLQCCYPAAELYKNYGDGYRLDCLVKETCNIAKLHNYFIRFVPNILIESQLINNIVFFIPYYKLESLIELLEQLPTHNIRLYLIRYSVSESHLENILINKVMISKLKKSIFYKDALQGVANEMRQSQEIKSIIEKHRYVPGWWLFLGHLYVILQKRFLVDLRYRKIPFFQIFLPSILAFAAMSLPHMATTSRSEMLPSFPITLTSFMTTTSWIVLQVNTTNTAIIASSEHYFKRGKLKTKFGSYESLKLDPNRTDLMDFLLNEDMDNNSLTNHEFIVAAIFNDDNVEALYNSNLWHSSALSLAMIMDALAIGYVSGDSGISVTLDPLPYSTIHGVEYSPYFNHFDLAFVITLTFGYLFLWTLPMLNETLQKTGKFNHIDQVGGIHMRGLYASTIIYGLIKVIVSLCPLNAVFILFNNNKLIYWEAHFAFIYVILILALCILSLNNLIVRCVVNGLNSYIAVLIISSFFVILGQAMLNFTEYSQSYMSYLEFIPIISLALNLMDIYNQSDLQYICSDKQTIEITLQLKHCHVQPNCCDVRSQGLNIIGKMWKAYILILLTWLLSYLVEGSIVVFWRKRVHEDRFDSDPDSCYDNYKLHKGEQNEQGERDKTWINEKIRVRTLERGRIQNKALFVEGFGVFIDSRAILNRINFMIEPYQLVALLGGHGSGKSVMLQAMIGIMQISTGSIYSNSQRAKIKDFLNIGYCAQENRILEGLTVVEVFQNILLVRGLRGDKVYSEAIKLCKVFNLYSHRFHMLDCCSRGTIKCLSVAIAIISSRALTLLDDPFAFLDVCNRRIIYNVINKICNSGQSVLYTTSDANRCDLAHRIIIIKDTGICAIGDEIELMRIHKSIYYKVSVKMHVKNFLRHRQLNENTEFPDQILFKFIQSVFPEALIKTFVLHTITFMLPRDVYSMSKILKILEEHKNEFEFYSYCFSPPTMSMLFMDFEKEPKDSLLISDMLK